MTVKTFHGGRSMLNLPGHHSTGAITAEIQNTSNWPADVDRWERPDFIFVIANCDRSISFDVDFDTEEELKNSLYKIDTMVDILRRFRRGVAVEGRRALKRRKAWDG